MLQFIVEDDMANYLENDIRNTLDRQFSDYPLYGWYARKSNKDEIRWFKKQYKELEKKGK